MRSTALKTYKKEGARKRISASIGLADATGSDGTAPPVIQVKLAEPTDIIMAPGPPGRSADMHHGSSKPSELTQWTSHKWFSSTHR
jgi:hypothetical protein